MEGVDIFTGVIAPYINLAIFLVLATLMLRGPIRNALSAKRNAYEELVKKASAAKEEAEKRNLELKERLVKLDREVDDIRVKAQAQAEQEARQVVANAEALAEHLKREARRIAEAEIAAAKENLQREIIEQVKLQTVEQLKAALDDNRQHQVVQQSLKTLGGVRAVPSDSTDADVLPHPSALQSQTPKTPVRAEVNS
ncbi:MAG TPA: ATP synthase F0 subunit B [Oligoflexus sp.]|uniref:ATP synthase F0 subunit B n=1 Tax=Oligoflexus sp. TaxID=1971216 RepID=UPI002D8005BA|nr:ATP synthase F0 subunit B [Oligoflexus sp.]HET9238874.1 ATP synthase F0 subunit B [Oligoflexus sp.]